MKLTEQDIKKYQEIYFRKFGTNISKEKVLEDGLSLVLLVQLVKKNYLRKLNKS
jgi:hypothetical protein